MSVVAVIVGAFVLIPAVVSVYNFGVRIKRAQRLAGIDESETINPVVSILLLFPGAILIVPAFFHYWYVTKHQNAAVRAAAGLPAWDARGSVAPLAVS